jgi:probable RNA-binding protein EIF1AD
MPRPKRLLQQAAEITTSPPENLSDTQGIARVVKATGNNLYQVTLSSSESVLVELPSKFRNLVWIKRGGFVVVDSNGENLAEGRDNKIWGEIVNIVREERAWRKMSYWPEEFKERKEDESGEENTVGEMPTDDEDED